MGNAVSEKTCLILVPPFLHSFNKQSLNTLCVLVLVCSCSILLDVGDTGM